MKVTIVGAGFAGLACARACAARGLRTVVLERKPAVGSSPHTTGILVKEAADAWDVPRAITRTIRGVRLYAPSLRSVDLASPGYSFLATDTPALLRWFARQAEESGAEIRTGVEWDGARDGAFLVGADGPRSRVARTVGLGINREFLTGVEAEFEGVRGVDESVLHCFLDPALAPGYLGWVVPGVGITQVGLACRRPRLEPFLRKVSRVFDFGAARVVQRRAGLIPVGGTVRPFAAKGVLLVGDAAGLVSPLTGGGIHTALHHGRRAGLAIADHLLDGTPEMRVEYPRFAWKLLLRRLFDLRWPARLMDGALANPAFRALAQTVFFHHRGLFSAAAWRDFYFFARRASILALASVAAGSVGNSFSRSW